MLNKKATPKSRQAFTLIELLIIVAIMGILLSVVLITLNIARNRAKDASFKSTAKSVQTGLVSCCLNSETVLGNTVNQPICTGGGNYPGDESIGTISTGNCTGSSFSKEITPGTKNSGNCTKATITTENIIYAGTGC